MMNCSIIIEFKDMLTIRFFALLAFAFCLVVGYVQFQIMRNPHQTKALQLVKSQCQDPATLSQQVKYEQICYEKDIAYVFEFDHLKKKKYLALDLTSPISWIKDQKCKTITNNKTCTLLTESLNQKITGAFKQKINDLINKLKKQVENDDGKAIIEGTNEIIMGDVDQVKNLSIIGQNHGHFEKIIDVFLLGLYIIGQNDSITLNTTTFINAHKISQNLNNICDGSISLRFDQNSEKSFLNQVFDYLKTKQSEKIISIFLGKDKKVVTIGGIVPKYAENGISSFTRAKLEQSDYGKLPKMQGLIFQSGDDETNIEAEREIVFTLSASYIAFSQTITEKIIKQFFPSTLKCKINNDSFIQCLNSNKEDVRSVKESSLDIDLDTSMIHFLMKDLVLKEEKGKITFNIKQAQCNNTIVGEPFFDQYYAYFDYHRNQIGYTPRKLTLEESFISALTSIHIVMLSLLLGCCFVLTSNSSKKLYYHLFQKVVEKTHKSIKNTIKSYQPVVDEQDEKETPKNKIPELEEVEGI